MRCPACNDIATHIDFALIAARTEDREFNEIAVNAISGQIQTHRAVPAPMGSKVKEGRRQRIALPGWCEVCGADFAIVFTQHKGVTFVEVVAEVPDEFRANIGD
jgi:hypothetical protein